MMIEQLTMEQIECLEYVDTQARPDSDELITECLSIYKAFRQNGLVDYYAYHDSWNISDTGKQALAAYTAQRDLVLFIAEFEKWLEGEAKEWDEEYDSVWARACKQMINEVLTKYLSCKERITNDE